MENPFDDPLRTIEKYNNEMEETRQKRKAIEQEELRYLNIWESAINQPSVQRLITLGEELNNHDVKTWIRYFNCDIRSTGRIYSDPSLAPHNHLRKIATTDILLDSMAGNRDALHEKLDRALKVMSVGDELSDIKESFLFWLRGGGVSTPWITRQELVKSLKGDIKGQCKIRGLSARGIVRAIRSTKLSIEHVHMHCKFQRYLHIDPKVQNQIFNFVCDFLEFHKIV
jgi:head-tail adaptor